VISPYSAHEHLAKMRPANIQLWYNPVKSREPKPSQTPIIIADEKTHEETPMKQELKRKMRLQLLRRTLARLGCLLGQEVWIALAWEAGGAGGENVLW
jgi:hypothetical protein